MSNRAPSAVISPITLPEMSLDSNTQPIESNGLLSLSSEPLLASEEFSDLLSAPESASSNTNSLADLLGAAPSGGKSHKSSKVACKRCRATTRRTHIRIPQHTPASGTT
ncbi:hypothetical protein BT96DRAFT_1007487 [Gymnopus androsaceus JB14]|uniref:Uncharacterized protein n=1 Tax=Gymnopus androsaceus JB14 TaxID=1447944 RepID=A0A6A4GI08_9AGAR|nr:hypothetical protein BT96DRAFT_1007487 [Gymnopus androsaceus JB14]